MQEATGLRVLIIRVFRYPKWARTMGVSVFFLCVVCVLFFWGDKYWYFVVGFVPKDSLSFSFLFNHQWYFFGMAEPPFCLQSLGDMTHSQCQRRPRDSPLVLRTLGDLFTLVYKDC